MSELTPGEIVAIYNYTTCDYTPINRFCRDRESNQLVDDALTIKIDLAIQAMDKMSPAKKYVGMSFFAAKKYGQGVLSNIRLETRSKSINSGARESRCALTLCLYK